MKLGAAQCVRVFRLDRRDCRSCAGYRYDCPLYSPAGGRENMDQGPGPGTAGELPAGPERPEVTGRK